MNCFSLAALRRCRHFLHHTASLPPLHLYLNVNQGVREPQGAGSERVVAGICRLLGFPQWNNSVDVGVSKAR